MHQASNPTPGAVENGVRIIVKKQQVCVGLFVSVCPGRGEGGGGIEGGLVEWFFCLFVFFFFSV